MDWITYKQHEFIFHSSGDWEVQDQGVDSFGVWWRPCFLVHCWLFRLCPYLEEESRELWDLTHNSIGPVHKDSALKTWSAPERRLHFPTPSCRELGLDVWIWCPLSLSWLVLGISCSCAQYIAFRALLKQYWGLLKGCWVVQRIDGLKNQVLKWEESGEMKFEPRKDQAWTSPLALLPLDTVYR